MAYESFCECESDFCPHPAAGCKAPPAVFVDIYGFKTTLCNECCKRHEEFAGPGEVTIIQKIGMKKKADYEGWTNWETWNVALLIDNEETTSNLARLMARNALLQRNRGQFSLNALALKFSRTFARQERQVKKYHEDSAADARDERGKYEAQQLQGKPELTKEELAAMSSEERVKHVGDGLQGIFFDMGGTSDWEKPMEPVNWKEIATNYLDIEEREQGHENKKAPEVDPLNEKDKAELAAMGIIGSKKAMITSDTQLESKPVPTGEAPKDDLAVNSHPANEGGDGAPVLDGELHHTERPNVNAMRGAIETQDEMEVGKSVDTTQKEVKSEGKEVTVDKGSGTQIIINIAGKKKTLTFSNVVTADAFVKGASAKYGDKFKVAFFDKKVKLTPEETTVYDDLYSREMNNAHSEYMGEVNAQMDERNRQRNVWEEMVKRFPRLKGYVGAKAASAKIVLKPGDQISWHLNQFSNESRHGKVADVLPENPEGLVIFDAKQEDLGGNPKGHVWGYMGLIWEINGQQVKPVNPEAAEFEVVQSNSSQQDVDNNAPITSGINDINGAGPAFKGASDSLDKAENLEHLTKQDAVAQDKKYGIYTGPTIVRQVAQKLREAGFLISGLGTERVYVITDQGVDSILTVLGPTWKNRDIQEMPRKREDDAAHAKIMEKESKMIDKKKEAAGLPPEEYKACYRLEKELGLPYGEVVDVFLQFPNEPLNVRIEKTRYKLLQDEAAIGKAAGFSYFFPGQVLENFYPEIQHELVEYPNATNAPMPAEMTGDAFEVAPGQLEDAVDSAFNGLSMVGYVSTSPAGGMGIGRDGKSQVLEGAPLRKENDIRGPMFTDEFYANYEAIPGGALSVVSKKVAAAEEKQQFTLFLKKVMGEVAATFIAAFKCTSRMPLNKVPGVGEIQLAQVEQATNTSAFNIVNTGSRVKYLMEKLTDSEIQDAINDAWAQGAIWHDAKEGGFVYEVFVRAETIDTDSMIMKYKFVSGTKDSE